MNIHRIIYTLLSSLALAGCAGDDGEGELDVRIYGEAFIEEGIPADVFIDGWALDFDRFVIAVEGVEAGRAADDGRYAFDLTAASGGEGHEVTTLTVPSGGQELAYRVAPGGAAEAGNAADADAAMLEAMGWSLFVSGTATKDAASISFAWGFGSDTHYDACEVVESVPGDGAATTVITIHADHLFYDDLESPEPNVAFDLVAAADTDTDGTVTPEELRATDITAQERYQVGSAPITNLWDFIAAQTSTLGHIDGEGHCET